MQTPRISLVTPNFNLARHLELALRSVLEQDYPGLEYVVIDGGSTDGSVDIIRRHADRLAFWSSEPDGGLYDALGKGFARTTGEIMGWINSDDRHLPWTLSAVGEIFARFPEVSWITSLHHLLLNERDQAMRCGYAAGYNRPTFRRGANLPGGRWYARSWIQQESTFWRRSLWERAGGRVERAWRTGGDFELWTRFFEHAELYGVATPLAAFRRRAGQNSADHAAHYHARATEALGRTGGRVSGALASGFRRRALALLGRRPLARQLHPWMTRALVGLRILTPVRNIAWHGDRWAIETDYVV
jgi:glycosyltransferase involved in cell wall biosynthesis